MKKEIESIFANFPVKVTKSYCDGILIYAKRWLHKDLFIEITELVESLGGKYEGSVKGIANWKIPILKEEKT